MATHKLFTLKTFFDFMDERFTTDLVQRTMMNVCKFLWVLLCDCVLSLFRHLIKHLARSKLDDDDHENNSDTALLFHEQEDRIVRSSSGSNCLDFDRFCEEVKSEFTFGFQFQIKEEDLVNYKGVAEAKTIETGDDGFMENGLTTTMNTNKYQFVSVHDFGGFVAEPESASFTVHELFVEDVKVQQGAKIKDQQKELNENSNLPIPSIGEDDDSMETEVSSAQTPGRVDVSNTNSINHEEKPEESVTDDSGCEEIQELQEKSKLNLGENGGYEQEQVNWLGEFFIRTEKIQFTHEHEFESLDPQLESDDSSDGFSLINPNDVDSNPPVQEEINDDYDDDDDDYIELEPHQEILDNLMESANEGMKSTKFEEECKAKSWEFDSDEEEDEAGVLLEHQELIDQMKMELKNSRTGGLPTILEECETPKIKDDLKPLKIDEKLEHRDQMAEIQKFYKSYTEKMRKLDVLNYQTLQAIGFLKMKHPDQMDTSENSSLSALKSVLFPSFWPCKLRRIYADPTLKSITELHKDLETVYVGQTCLSWEILHWQYKKAKELEEFDPQKNRSYNQVAIEFQQFHVLLRRFSEDETFQGPRVQNYTKQRCDLRGILQVPAIKDDKKPRKEDEGDAVTISTLTNMIKESMRVFWEFLHSDNDTTNLFLTIILHGSKSHLQDPSDSDLLMDIKTSHQKKDKKLKDMLRTGNCIAKKFMKHQETILDQHMFVSQVELRLVSRVLSLPRLSRDQLVWCQTKLNNIKFIDRKVRVEETSFLIFPC